MELKIAVIDDMQKDIDNVISMTERFFRNKKNITAEVCSYSNGKSFFETFTKGDFHAIFVDICMGDMDGLELSIRLRAIDDDIAIIFMSSTTEFVFETFKSTPFGYLVKPYSFEQFSEVMEKTVKYYSKVDSSIRVRIPRSELSVGLDTIFSVVSNGHKTNVNTTSGQVIKTIEKYEYFKEELLKKENFVECNRGIIINMDCILTIKNADIVMVNGTLYPLRTRCRKELVSQITHYISQKIKGELFV